MGNSTEDRNASSSGAFKPRLSIERYQGDLATVTIIFCSLNILLSITASLGNTLILIALRKVTSRHSPTKLLFQCLAITDLGVGLISQPLYVIYNILLINFNLKLWNIIDILRYNLGVINLSLFSFLAHNDCSKSGQTSRPFVEAKVQARCNTEASSCSCFLLLVNSCFGHFHVLGLGYKHRLGSTFSLGNALYR